MRTIPLGPSGPPVSAVGYGGMLLSIQDRPPEDQGVRVIHAALDAGVTLIDTADAYCLVESEVGHNERLIARALRAWPGPRDGIVVATKGGVRRSAGRWDSDGRPEHLRRACEASLRALGVERIALYQLHAPDPRVPFEESVGALAELRREGKIELVGLSNVSVEQIRRARSIVPIASVQNRLNPFARESLSDGAVAYCAGAGIAFLAYSPVRGRRLSGRLPDHAVVRAIAGRHGVSPYRVVLAWVLAQAPVVIAIPSARREGHARDSAAAANLTLDPDDLRAIDEAEFART